MDASQDTLVIDPVKLNIVNRVAAGSSVSGEQLHFKGGLLLQGSLSGRGEVAGRLVVWPTGQLIGKYKVFLSRLREMGHLRRRTHTIRMAATQRIRANFSLLLFFKIYNTHINARCC